MSEKTKVGMSGDLDPYDAEAAAYDPSEIDDCIHVSHHEEAGGWTVCDDCGEDITSEIFRSARRRRGE